MDLQDLSTFPQTSEKYDEYFSAFSKAVKERNEELINVLISKEDILRSHFSENKDTLLHIVAQQGTVATATKICEVGLNVNFQNKCGETPIFHAIKHSTEMVNLLINNGASLSRKCNQYSWPLQEALLSGTEKTVQIIINKIFADKSEGHLRSTAVQTSEETIKAILHHTEDLNLNGNDYPLLIFFAAKVGNLDLFRLVLDGCRKYLDSIRQQERGPPPKELDFDGFVDRTALNYAVWQQDAEVVRFLLNEGADVNCSTRNHYTPLHFAAYLENEEICKMLLSFGAQTNLRDQRGTDEELPGVSPLYLVCGGNECFRPYDADGFVRNRISNQPHFELRPIFNLGIMKLLLQYRADPDFAHIDDGATPLLSACKAGRLEPVKLLLEFGANIRTCDHYGNSAIHYATCSDSFEIINLFLERGFDINIENGDGDDPLSFCLHNREETCVEMIEYLADVGANINDTSLEFVIHYDFPDIVECLLESGANFKVESILAHYIFYLNFSRKTLIAFFALKEDMLDDNIGNYIRTERNEISQIRMFFETCKLEIEQLKCTYILENRKFSFYDFLSRNIYSTFHMIQNKQVKKVFTCEEYKNQFPCYAYLMKKRFERLETLEKPIGAVIEFLHAYKEFNLPTLVVEKILSFLSSSDFRKFGRLCQENWLESRI